MAQKHRKKPVSPPTGASTADQEPAAPNAGDQGWTEATPALYSHAALQQAQDGGSAEVDRPQQPEGLMDKLARMARTAASTMGELWRGERERGVLDRSYNDKAKPWFGFGKRPVYRVLAIDGGGIRGLVPARVLEEIERRTGKPIAKQFDLIAGTSTGSVIGLGLTVPSRDDPTKPAYSAAEVARLYAEDGQSIFPPSRFKAFRQMMGPAYDAAPLREKLREMLGDTKMSESLTNVIVPAYDIERGDALSLRHIRNLKGASDPDYAMADVAAASSAAPTYFPPHRFTSVDGRESHACIDGGVIARNPTLFALTQAIKLAPRDARIEMVSLGTGSYPPKIPYEKAEKWGAVEWANPRAGSPMIGVMMDGASEMANRLAERLLGDGFLRLDMDIDQMPEGPTRPSGHLDDASPKNVARLEAFAKKLIEDNSDTIDRICATIDPGYTPQSVAPPTAAGPGAAPGPAR